MISADPITIFIVAGRTGHSLIKAKSLPFSLLEQINEIYLFTETRGFHINKCNYIVIPEWIKSIRPSFIAKILRFIYEPLQLLYYSYKIKPAFINGIYCLPKGLNSFIVSRLTGVKCVNSVIGSVLEIETELPFKVLWKNINLWQLRRCEAITIKGERDRTYLTSKGVDPQKMFLFNGAIDTDKFTYTEEERSIDILYVGSFIELKGTDRIITIVYNLLPLFPGLKVVMVGDGKLLGITKQRVTRLGIEGSVSFEGFQKETSVYFRQSKVLLMPSRSDSLPTSMLEAMACGCVPVISDVGNVTEAAKDEINSRVITDYNDIGSFVSAISDLLVDHVKLERLARSGRRTVGKHYSIESQSLLSEKIITYLVQN